MKPILLIASLLFSNIAFAKFFNFKNIYCEGKERKITKGERIFYDGNFFGYGQNEKQGKKNCRILDIFPIMITNFVKAEDANLTVFKPIAPFELGKRKSSCDEKVQPFQGSDFEYAYFDGKKFSFKNFQGCKIFEAQVKPY